MSDAHPLPTPSLPTAHTHDTRALSSRVPSDNTFGHDRPRYGTSPPTPPAPATPPRRHEHDLSLPLPAFSSLSHRSTAHHRHPSLAPSTASHASYASAGSEPQIVTAQSVLVRTASASSRNLLTRDRGRSTPDAGIDALGYAASDYGDDRPYTSRFDIPSYYSNPTPSPRARESSTSVSINDVASLPWAQPPPHAPGLSPVPSPLSSPLIPSHHSHGSLGGKSPRSARSAKAALPTPIHPYAFLAQDPVRSATASRPSSRASVRSRSDEQSPRSLAEPWTRVVEHQRSGLSAQTGHSSMAEAGSTAPNVSPKSDAPPSDRRNSARSITSVQSAQSGRSGRSTKSKRARQQSDAAASGQGGSHEVSGAPVRGPSRASKRASSSSVGHRYGGRKWKVLPGAEGEDGEMELAALVGRAAVLERLLRAGKRVSSSASVRRMSTSTVRSSFRSVHRSSQSLGQPPSDRSGRRSRGSKGTEKSASIRKRFAKRVKQKHGSDSEFEALTSADEGLWADEAHAGPSAPDRRRSRLAHPYAQPAAPATAGPSVFVFHELPPANAAHAAHDSPAHREHEHDDANLTYSPEKWRSRMDGYAPLGRPPHDGDVVRQSCLMPVTPAPLAAEEKRVTWALGAGARHVDVEAAAIPAPPCRRGVSSRKVALAVACGLGVVLVVGLLAGLLSARESDEAAG
ncbi:hypothetical protein Q5752_005889 [Cryptotrichosporon argae]